MYAIRSYYAVQDLAPAPRPITVSVTRSRFEADLNRPRDRAVYLTPADAWGHQVWRRASYNFV